MWSNKCYYIAVPRVPVSPHSAPESVAYLDIPRDTREINQLTAHHYLHSTCRTVTVTMDRTEFITPYQIKTVLLIGSLHQDLHLDLVEPDHFGGVPRSLSMEMMRLPTQDKVGFQLHKMLMMSIHCILSSMFSSRPEHDNPGRIENANIVNSYFGVMKKSIRKQALRVSDARDRDPVAYSRQKMSQQKPTNTQKALRCPMHETDVPGRPDTRSDKCLTRC
ncbi:hypothetical protein J6590_002463 [Homalodisca vitripennis]|nr:hypothetical protein J6590_002463 [Homalodisca vitripennis]